MKEDFFPYKDAIQIACGAVAEFDEDSGSGFRCVECGAIVGSMGMPKRCKEAMEKEKMWKILND